MNLHPPRDIAQKKDNAPTTSTPSPTNVGAAQRRVLFVPLLLLMIVAVAACLLLQDLYMTVQQAGPGKIDSFCAINKSFDCVTVAASQYSSIAGIPISLYGLEYFALILIGMLLSAFGVWRLRRWDSLLFVALLVAMPVSVTMATIAIFFIKSVCIMCSAIYGVDILATLIMLIAYRGQLRNLASAGLRELLSLGGPTRGVVATILLVGLSQFFWVPGLLGARKNTRGKVSTVLLKNMKSAGSLLGPKSAPILIEEFSDYQCPHCGRAHNDMVHLVKEMNGKVKFRHHDYPLDNKCNRKVRRFFHAHACNAAFYAHCAGLQGKYWTYTALLTHNPRSLSDSNLQAYGERLGLDANALRDCARKPETRKAILNDIEDGIRRGVQGTPTFFVKGQKIVGWRPPKWWRDKISALLRK
ncbi:MAG: thioredoxin domain-containing protein [Deltaproteobacteria bacterium]|nr:thioredoxin domain-containing protein [Deltaproteobacteria bacterium]